MNDDARKTRGPLFIIGVAVLAVLVAAVADWASTSFEISLGLPLLIGGVLVGGIGTVLARPEPEDPRNPRNRVWGYFHRPNELASDQRADDREHAAPRSGIEDVMIWAGFIDILLGVALIVLGK